MRKLAIFFLLVLQAFAYAGPVCGDHLTAAESMACCKKAHPDTSGLSISDSDANACCGSCDMGKTQAIKRQDHLSLQNIAFLAPAVFATASSIIVPELAISEWSQQKFTSHDPPEILLLTQSFRI